MDVETAVFGNYTCLVCGSSYTLSYTAGLPINTSPGSMQTSPLYVLRYTT